MARSFRVIEGRASHQHTRYRIVRIVRRFHASWWDDPVVVGYLGGLALIWLGLAVVWFSK